MPHQTPGVELNAPLDKLVQHESAADLCVSVGGFFKQVAQACCAITATACGRRQCPVLVVAWAVLQPKPDQGPRSVVVACNSYWLRSTGAI